MGQSSAPHHCLCCEIKALDGLAGPQGHLSSKCHNSRYQRGFLCPGDLLLESSLRHMGLIHDTDRKEESKLVTASQRTSMGPLTMKTISSFPPHQGPCLSRVSLTLRGGRVGGSWFRQRYFNTQLCQSLAAESKMRAKAYPAKRKRNRADEIATS